MIPVDGITTSCSLSNDLSEDSSSSESEEDVDLEVAASIRDWVKNVILCGVM